VKPPTGEPDAGKPPVRFGGRGSDKLSLPLSGLFIVSGGTGFAIMDYKHSAPLGLMILLPPTKIATDWNTSGA